MRPLGGVAGLGVAKLYVFRHEFDGEADGADASGDGDAVITVDLGDGPVVTVLDHDTLASPESSVVAWGDHLVAHQHHGLADSEPWSGWVELFGRDAGFLSEFVESNDCFGAAGH